MRPETVDVSAGDDHGFSPEEMTEVDTTVRLMVAQAMATPVELLASVLCSVMITMHSHLSVDPIGAWHSLSAEVLAGRQESLEREGRRQ